MKRFLFFTIFLLGFFPFFIYAQLTPTDALKELTENVSIKVSPENPKPNSTVVINIESYSVDLNSSTITWSVEGRVMKNGVGEVSFSTILGNLNSPTTVSINIKPLESSEFTKTIIIRPATVDLLIKGLSSVPVFYKGIPLFTKQNSVLLVAIPNNTNSNGSLIKSDNFIYTWSKDGTVLGNSSGYGKNSLKITDTNFSQPMKITVRATNINKTFQAENSMIIAPTDPFVLFYENNPLYGLRLEKSLQDNFTMKEKEMSIVGFPFYFALIDLTNGGLEYIWSLNNKIIDTPSKTSITLRQGDSGSGVSSLGLRITNLNRFMQTGESVVNIKYNNETAL